MIPVAKLTIIDVCLKEISRKFYYHTLIFNLFHYCTTSVPLQSEYASRYNAVIDRRASIYALLLQAMPHKYPLLHG